MSPASSDLLIPVEQIRSQFPALSRRHNGQPVAYFDGPGGTQVPVRVVDAMRDYLLHHNANTHWNYTTSRETDAALAHARQVFADFFNCSPTEVAFGNTIVLTNAFVKKTQKTPLREISLAEQRRADYLSRKKKP